jgi:membrane associated rhomboid family serine protease
VLPILAIAAVAGVAVGAMTADERRRWLERCVSLGRTFLHHSRRAREECEPFRGALRERTPIAMAVPSLVAVNAAVYVLTHFGAARHGTSGALVDWGASFGPRTTNGEWWRLLTSTFVQPGALLLLVTTGALTTAGLMLERYLGAIAFLTIYFVAGIVSGLVNLRWHPVVVSGGASASIFGLYGLLLASLFWNARGRRKEQRPDRPEIANVRLSIPSVALKRLVSAAAAFIVCSFAGDGLPMAAELAAIGTGFAGGLVLAKRADEARPSARLAGLVMLTAIAPVFALAFPVRAIADVAPEMERILAVEQRTADLYQFAYERFKRGRVSARSVADLIEQKILPELRTTDANLKALTKVPLEDQPLVTDAERYTQLRSEGWRLRAEGLRRTGTVPERDGQPTDPALSAKWRLRAEAMYRANTATLGKAEAAERGALEALRALIAGLKARATNAIAQ